MVRMRSAPLGSAREEQHENLILSLITGAILMTGIATAQERTRSLVKYDTSRST